MWFEPSLQSAFWAWHCLLLILCVSSTYYFHTYIHPHLVSAHPHLATPSSSYPCVLHHPPSISCPLSQPLPLTPYLLIRPALISLMVHLSSILVICLHITWPGVCPLAHASIHKSTMESCLPIPSPPPIRHLSSICPSFLHPSYSSI